MTDRGELLVRGGAGGVQARLEEIDRAGQVLRAAASDLADQGRAVLAVSVDPGLQRTVKLSAPTFARAEACLVAAALGPAGLLALAGRVEQLGLSAQSAAHGYRIADQTVTGTLRTGAVRFGQLLGVAAGALTAGTSAPAAVAVSVLLLSGAGRSSGARTWTQPEPLRRIGERLLRLLAEHASLTEAAIPVLSGAIGGFNATGPGASLLTAPLFGRPGPPVAVTEIAGGLGVLGGLGGAVAGGPAWFQDRTEVQIRATPVPWLRPPSGTADLLGRIPAVSPGQPQIHVERVDGRAGRHWVVAVPGTADWSPVARRTPFDVSGDVRLMAGGRSAGMAAVVAAMQEIGIRRGEPVLLVGHSQGGLVAAALAADPIVRREFSVSHVLTSGAPVASIPVPDHVQVLSIEHADDLVPRLDGSANGDRPNWTTVTAPAPAAGLSPADRTEPLLAHRAELYRRTAERIDASLDPSIEHWRAGLTPFLGGRSGPGDGGPVSGAGWDVEVIRSRTP